ncbi:MAG: STM4012 family radical SAM protein [Pseudomonadota bacterium]|nr:STM4012 family radical SAM protein [Pseudomonadota bacterium]
MTESLRALLASGEYLSYAYAYPHKTTYRTLAPPVGLRELWAEEDRGALFLYVHVPFCEQRCGFCNLYTQVRPKSGVEARYVEAVERQAAVLSNVLSDTTGPARFARLAIGGGTPTFLGAALLERVFALARRLGAADVPTSIEVSPGTLDDDQLGVLVANRVTRVSVGVQSILPNETASVQRGQALSDVERVVRRLAAAVPVCNVDLIYGLPGQTAETLRRSIDHVLNLGANELYLYPLYVRPLTGLGRRDGWDDHRLALYRAGREHLLALGWAQGSMRMFQAPGSPEPRGAVYRCQDDGMVGLGAGARSYTRSLHYASPYAVSQGAIRAGIEAWMGQSDAEFSQARHGIRLGDEERRRRYVLLSLLEAGLDRAAYVARFGADVMAHLPELAEAVDVGLIVADEASLDLTEAGLERSDVLGHWLQSAAVRAARAGWEAA